MEEYLQRINNSRPFVGHHKEQQIFWEALKSHKDKDRHSILFYDGIPGIGKSGLLNLLSKDLRNRSDDIDTYVSATIDFADERYATDWLTGLEELRYQFAHKYKVNFDTYDIAYFIYLKRTNPRIKLETKHSRLLENSNLLIALMQFAESYETGESSEYWGVTKLLAMVAKFIDQKALPVFSQWWKTRGNKELNLLRDIEKPHEMADLLPHFFALDIKNYLKLEEEEGYDTQAVIFLDTYEKLRNDEWIHKLVKQLPEVFWVFAGQKQLDWEKKYASQNWNKNICQCTVDGLLKSEALSFLEQCKITDKAIVERILSIYQGIPYYLNLLVDLYLRADNPTIEDFPEQHEEIHNLFIRNLSEGERSTFYMLSCLLSWNSQLLLKLLQQFPVGESIQKVRQIVPSFSFIILRGDNEYAMHEVMRSELYNRFKSDDLDFVNEIHQFCYDYFQELCANHTEAELLKQHITSAVYHGFRSLPPNEMYGWISEQSKNFNLDVDYAFFVPILEEAQQWLTGNKNLLQLAKCLNWLGAMYFEQGENELAENRLRESLNLYQKNHSEVDESEISSTKLNLFSAKAVQYKFDDESEELLQSILNEEGELENSLKTIYRLNTCAAYLASKGIAPKAEQIYRRAQLITQQLDKESFFIHSSSLLNNFGLFLVDTGNYEEVLMILLQALVIETTSPGTMRPTTAAIYHNIGHLFLELRQFQYAEAMFKKALGIKEELLMTKHPGYAKTLFNLGKSYLLRYEINKKLIFIEQADAMLNQALRIQQKYPSIGIDIALTLNALGSLSQSQNDPDKAIYFYRRSLAIRTHVLPDEHPELLSNLVNLGELLILQKKFAAAEPLLRQALVIRSNPTFARSFDVSKEELAKNANWLSKRSRSTTTSRLTTGTGRGDTQVTYIEREGERYYYEIDYYVKSPEATCVIKIENLSDFTVAISLDNISATVKTKASTCVFNGLPVDSEWIAYTDEFVSKEDIKIRVSFARVRR